jgi:alpha-amylase
MQKIFFGILLIFVTILFTASVSAAPTEQESNDDLPWWNNRVFYEVFVRAFEDSDGDGNGDLQGLISKLDYLNDGDPATDTDLGVTGLWLMPVMQSPSYHGYDVTDYEQIEADYGSNEDFKQLVVEAHERSIAVIVDMVINHTSTQHPWFIDAETPGSTHDSWYRWSATNPGYAGPWGQPVWHSERNRYYYGVFWSGMPDLNLRNPAVTQSMYAVADFWLNEMGVDGFREDAIKHLVEDGQKQENTTGTITWLTKWQAYLKSVKSDVFTVGEVQSSSAVTSLYVPEGVDTTFEFELSSAIANSVNRGTNDNVAAAQRQLLERFGAGQYSAFLSNHDFNRIMNVFNKSVDKSKVAASILLTQPGVPFLYYGEEIGMTGLKPDECLRVPFQWDVMERVAPFMAGKNCVTNEADANLADQENDPDSLFNHYRSMIHLRNEHPSFQIGSFEMVESTSNAIYSFIRDSPEETLLVLINLSDETVSDYELDMDSGSLSDITAANMLLAEGEVTVPTVNSEGGFSAYVPVAELDPYSTTVVQLE